MKQFDPQENERRVRATLVGAISGKPSQFDCENANLIAVFDEPFTKYSGGRITSFQEYVQEITGSVPVIVKQIPACIKAFFHLELEEPFNRKDVLSALGSEESKEMYRSLGISQVQFGAKIITPSP
ncbi:MAG: hypothetical protein WDN02_10995 [Methylovirgula sp.]|uniref:hypothetical protein n=1 Tax=Methylovirgula sp. TaxID=1978224 RepID=UPI0030761F69